MLVAISATYMAHLEIGRLIPVLNAVVRSTWLDEMN